MAWVGTLAQLGGNAAAARRQRSRAVMSYILSNHLAALPGRERRVLPPDKRASTKSEHEYEILQRFQVTSDEFYRRKRESIFAQLTPGNSVHRPIDLESSDEEETDVEDMCVEDLAPRQIDF